MVARKRHAVSGRQEAKNEERGKRETAENGSSSPGSLPTSYLLLLLAHCVAPKETNEALHDSHRAGGGAAAGQCRSGPDHPQAVPEANRTHRVRGIPVL